MERIYEFLQANAINDPEARRVLETMRFIAVEEGKKFILPTQAVIELYEHFEIKPFLYRIPAVFGKFQTLFEFVGCSKTVSCRDYAVVLEMMHEKCKGSKLNPNELTKCSKAIRGFFKTLQDDPRSVLTLSKLYLPAMPSEFCLSNEHLKISTIPVTLRLSTELLFDDAPTYGYRIKGLEQPFVLELSLLNVSRKSAMINFTDLMLKLPPEVQPRMLSSVVKEKLCDPVKTKIVANGAVDTMKVKISSIPFARGVARIIKHVNHQDKDFDLSVLRGIEESLRSIDLFAVEGLRTSLFLYEVQIPESEADVPFLVDKPELSALGKSKVYIDTLSGVSDAIPIISDIIGEMYGEFLQKKANLIGEMLRCPPSSIWPLLDRMKVRKDDSYTTADLYIYPEPGTLIPIEDHHLLKEAFEEFEAGEYVGYQLHDPSLAQREGTPTYIYAIIVEEINSEDTAILTKAYRINIEHDKEAVEVSAGRLYKFHRLQEIFEEQDEDMDGVLKEISDILQNAWEIPEDERTQIVKRLFMRWFPRKDALQHLMNEVSRLGGGYDDLFALLEERVKRRDSQRKKYEEDYGPWPPSPDDDTPPIFLRRTRKNPQPEEAKRWLRQADADLESCSRERACTTDSFEWLCFKCHQAAEKALKAVQYNVDANQKTNDHNLVLNCHGFDESDAELKDLAAQLERLVINSVHMRYPNTMSYPNIPHDVYTAVHAEEAFRIATKILEIVQVKLN
ncbi:sacsin-like [Porites lutea]|uniref:sacsin-like n=1 Tax=Porites lutea TaxID=51062 RepID=UPI003CC683A1